MSVVPEITFHNMEPSEAIEARVREKFARLQKYFDRLTHCRVVIEAPHRHHHKGKIYQIKIDLGVPGRPDLVVSREGRENHAHEDVYVAVRDAFDAARRQLQDAIAKMSGEVKTPRKPRKAVKAADEGA